MSYQNLTLQQEQEMLTYLKANMDLFIGSGSSRAVFRCDETMRKIFQLDNIAVELIVKMSLGLGGYRQSSLEVSTYNYIGNTGCLADIYARGSIFTVMERLDIDYDFDDFYQDVCYEGDLEDFICNYHCADELDTESYRRLYNKYLSAYNTITKLDEYLGQTGDNSQLGWSEIDGVFKAYDYGFDAERLSSEQMTESSNYFAYGDEYNTELFEIIMVQVEEILAAGGNALGEKEFQAIEESFIDFCENWERDAEKALTEEFEEC